MREFLKTLLIIHLPMNEKGQDLAEYALLIGLLALALVGSIGYLTGGLQTTFNALGDAVASW